MFCIYFVRHGQTDWNFLRKFQGQQDIPLNDLGRRQAQAVSERLRRISFDVLYSSDLSRAYETAEMINAHHRLPIHVGNPIGGTLANARNSASNAPCRSRYATEIHNPIQAGPIEVASNGCRATRSRKRSDRSRLETSESPIWEYYRSRHADRRRRGWMISASRFASPNVAIAASG